MENEDFCSKPAAPRDAHLLAACYAGHAFFETSKKEGKKAPLFLCICHAHASEHFTFAKQIFHREAISLALVKGQISLAQPAAPRVFFTLSSQSGEIIVQGAQKKPSIFYYAPPCKKTQNVV